MEIGHKIWAIPEGYIPGKSVSNDRALTSHETACILNTTERDADVTITLERTACYGTCPVYKLTITGDGMVVYEGRDFVEVKGEQTSSISPAQVQDLVDAFEQANFLSLHDYTEQVVFRHEQTLSKPKNDRLNLLKATRAHFGQIFMLYSGSGTVDALLESSRAPDIEVTDEYSVVHRVWKVSDPGTIARVQEEMKRRNLIIADGHHRYETALAYRNERRAAAGNANPAAYDSVMMTFVDMDRPGLVVLPTHRLVFGLPSLSPVPSGALRRKCVAVNSSAMAGVTSPSAT